MLHFSFRPYFSNVSLDTVRTSFLRGFQNITQSGMGSGMMMNDQDPGDSLPLRSSGWISTRSVAQSLGCGGLVVVHQQKPNGSLLGGEASLDGHWFGRLAVSIIVNAVLGGGCNYTRTRAGFDDG